MKQSDDFPTGDKLLRKEDHQAFPLQVIFEMKGGNPRILQAIPGDKTMFRRPASSPKCRPGGVASRQHRPGHHGRREAKRLPCAPHRGRWRSALAVDRAQQGQLRDSTRRNPRDHRTERRGQEHLLQLPHRRAARRPRVASCSTARTSPDTPPNLDLAVRASRALLPDHQHPAERHHAGRTSGLLPQSRRHGWNMLLRHHPALLRHHREGGGGA